MKKLTTILNFQGQKVYEGTWNGNEDYTGHTPKARALNLANDIILYTNDGYDNFGSFEDAGIVLDTGHELHFENEKYKVIITEDDLIATLK